MILLLVLASASAAAKVFLAWPLLEPLLLSKPLVGSHHTAPPGTASLIV
jgi:hypothetical protein